MYNTLRTRHVVINKHTLNCYKNAITQDEKLK